MRRLLCVGDSNTWGYDPRSWAGGRYAPDVRWTGRLPGWEALNDGVNGRTIPDAREYADTLRLLSDGTIDAAVVMLGTNDLLQGASAATAGTRLEPFLCSLLAAGGTRILVITPPPFERGDWVTGEAQIGASRELAGVYRALAQKLGVGFADAGEWGVALSYDGVHFTPEGHAAFARGLSEALSRL